MGNLFTTQVPGGSFHDGTPSIVTGTTLVFAADDVVTALSFYKGSGWSGNDTVRLFRVNGNPSGGDHTLIATTAAIASGSSSPGRNALPLVDLLTGLVPVDSVNVSADQLYIVAPANDAGNYVATVGFFGSDLVNGNITGPAAGSNPTGAGAVSNGSFSIPIPIDNFPDPAGGSTCFFGDVVTGASPSAVDLTPAVATFAGVTVSPVPGRVTVALTPASGTFAGVATSPVPGRVSVALEPALATFQGVPVVGVPGRVTVALHPALGTWSAVPIVANRRAGQYAAGRLLGPGWTASDDPSVWRAT